MVAALSRRPCGPVLGLDELVGRDPGQPQQGQGGPLAELQVLLGRGLEARDRDPARERAVAVEVQEAGQPAGQQDGQLAGDLLVAGQQPPLARVGPLDGDLLAERVGPGVATALQVGLVQLEGGRDGGGAGDLGPVPAAQAARVVAQLVEALARPQNGLAWCSASRKAVLPLSFLLPDR